MIHFQSEFIGQRIFARYDGRECGKAQEIVIDHEKGKILGILTEGKIIAIVDIVSWHPRIEVLQFSVLKNKEEDKSINNELNSEIKILKNAVKTKSGQKIGRVIDYIVDVEKGALSSIYVAKSVFGIWNFDKRIIPASQIIEIQKDKIIIQKNIAESRLPVKDFFTAKERLKSAGYCLNSTKMS